MLKNFHFGPTSSREDAASVTDEQVRRRHRDRDNRDRGSIIASLSFPPFLFFFLNESGAQVDVSYWREGPERANFLPCSHGELQRNGTHHVCCASRREGDRKYTAAADNTGLFSHSYTPTVGWACKNYSRVYTRPRGMFFSAADAGHMHAMAYNWPQEQARVLLC